MSVNTIQVLLVVTCFGFAPHADADLFIRYLPSDIAKRSAPSQAGGPIATQPLDAPPLRGNLDIFVAHGRVLLSGTGRSGREYSVWFNSADDTFHVLERSHKGVFEVSPATFSETEAGRQRLQQDRDERLGKSPPKDHEKIRSFADTLEQRLYGARPRLAQYRATGKPDRSGAYSCTRTDVLLEQRKLRELCTTNYTDLNIDADDWSVLEQMHRVGKEIATTTAIGARLIPRFVLDLAQGIPVTIKYLEPATNSTDLILQRVSKERIARDIMAGYQAYRKLPLPAHRPGV